MARRYYSSTAARTTLASGVDDTTTTLSVTAVSGWPSSFPYTLVLDQDTVNEELVSVSARSGTTLTVTRGVDGTTAVAHTSGAAVNHGVSAQDFDEPNAFINGTGVVTETLLATDSVSAVKIVDGTITNAKIGASADIAQSKIENLTSDLASKLPYSYGTATPSTTDDGFLWYDENDTPPTPKFWDGAAFQALTSGKILQVVRDTDSTSRSTTSTSFVDVTGMSVTITPTKSTSAVLIITSGYVKMEDTTDVVVGYVQITDSSNNAISGANSLAVGTNRLTGTSTREVFIPFVAIAYATPATTSAVTYKTRFRCNNATGQILFQNASNTGQMYALEISA